MGAMAGHLGFRETGVATASVLGVIAATVASLGVIWQALKRFKSAVFVWDRLVEIPRNERAQRHAEAIQKPILDDLNQLREENASQHKEIQEAMSVLSARVSDLEQAYTTPRKERL